MNIAPMWGMPLVALAVAALALSGQAPKQDAKPASAQQTKPAQKPAAVQKKPPTGTSEKRGCPGTRFPDASCEAITAEATMRQVDIAADQSRIATFNNWVSLITAFIAGAAAWFAASASRSARATVKAFTDVEKADIHLTLEKFQQEGFTYDAATDTSKAKSPKLTFKVKAHNIGRSSALIVHAASGWHDSMDIPENMALLGKPKTYIVKPGDSSPLDLHARRGVHDLDKMNFFWVLLIYNSPLRGQRFIRYCFEVWGLNASVPYIERIREEWDPKERKRKWTPLGVIEPARKQGLAPR